MSDYEQGFMVGAIWWAGTDWTVRPLLWCALILISARVVADVRAERRSEH